MATASLASFFLELIGEEGKPIYGESREIGFEGQIEVTSWSWGYSDKAATPDSRTTSGAAGAPAPQPSGSVAARRGAEGVTGKALAPTEITFAKPTDKATPRILQGLVNGETFRSAVFTLRQRMHIENDDERHRDLEFRVQLNLEGVKFTKFGFTATGDSDGVELKDDWTVTYDCAWVRYEFGSVSDETPRFDKNQNSGSIPAPSRQQSPTEIQKSINTSQDSIQSMRTNMQSLEDRLRELEREVRRLGRS